MISDDGRQGHAQAPQEPDGAGSLHLGVAVEAVAIGGVDVRGDHEAELVVETQRLG